MPDGKLRIKTISHLGHRLGVPPGYLEDLASRAHGLYRFWSKPKSSGGVREYSEPKPELKILHKQLHGLFKTLTYPDTSHYGISDRSNITNGLAHRCRQVILKFDLKGFYPSIHPNRVNRALIDEQHCSPPVASIITKLVTVNFQLPQGAPTSTDIANIVTLKLQRRFKGLADNWGYTFTALCDDLTFSGDKPLEGFNDLVRQVIVEEGFISKREKEKTATKSEAQRVTGVDLGHGVGVSRQRRNFWKAEVNNARKNFSNKMIDQKALDKAEQRFLGRLNYVKTVKRLSANQ